MTLTGMSLVTVTGTYVKPTGTPVGFVTFTPSVGRIVNSASSLSALLSRVVGTLDDDGAFSVQLPCTDDADWSPSGFTWKVREVIDGVVRTYSISLPASPAAVDLSDVAPTDPVVPATTYVAAGDYVTNAELTAAVTAAVAAALADYSTTAEMTSAIATHAADTSSVHGITDTTVLETTTGAQTKATTAQTAAEATAAAALTTHAADTSSVHGITDTTALETVAGAAAQIATHTADTTSVHGITDTSILATTDDVSDLAAQTTTDIATHAALRTTHGAVAAESKLAVLVSPSGTAGKIHVREDDEAAPSDGDDRDLLFTFVDGTF